MLSMQEFLRSILPANGYKCLAIFRNGKPHHQWFDDFAKMEMAALSADAQGATVYHGCSSFATTTSRRAINAQWVKSFWLDVDAGPSEPGKPDKTYQDSKDAYRATESFRQTVGLPAPLYVRSGLHGLHVYWPLAVELDPQHWLDYAHGLKQLCQLHGFAVDPARTTDIASILRPIGTHNRKGGFATPVICGPLVGPYPLEQFAALRVAPATPRLVRSVASRRADDATQPVATTLTNSLKEAFYRKVDAADVVAGCKQVQRISTSVADKVRYPEPLWHAVAAVMAFVEGGDAAVRQWANGYDGYDEASSSAWIQVHLDRARQEISGPTTCARLAQLDPDGCAGCPLAGKITTPARIGTTDETKPKPEPAPDAEPDGKPWLPKSYEWDKANSLVFVTESNGDRDETLISQYPLYLESVGNGEANDETFAYNFRLCLPMGGERHISIGARQFHSADGLAILSGRGAVIHDAPLFRRYVAMAVDHYNADQLPAVRYEQFGWKDSERAFLWGRNLYTPHNVLPAAAVEEVAARGRQLGIAKSGSLARWTAIANRLFAGGCEPYSFALLCSFAAPLMRFHSTDEGGAIVCLVGPPGVGKTTALDAAGSVWGQHRALDLNSFDTRASRGVNLGVLGNLPVLYDEMEKQDADVLREFVAIFTNGRDRNRATVDGQLRHEARSWQTILIAAANKSVVELVSRYDDRDGLSSRILELPGHLPEGMTDAEATALRREIKEQYGWAADLYLRMLTQPEIVAWVKTTLLHHTDTVWKRTGFDRFPDKRHRFWVRTIAAVWTSSLLVEKLGLLAFSPQRIVDWAIETVTKDSTARNTPPIVSSTGVLAEFINAHLDCMINVAGPYDARNRQVRHIDRPPRNLFVRYEHTPPRFLIAEKPLREWLDKRKQSLKQLLGDLDGTVVTNRRKLATLSAGTDIPGGQVYVVEVNGAHPALTGVLADVEKIDARVLQRG